jgi:hypothetical protein
MTKHFIIELINPKFYNELCAFQIVAILINLIESIFDEVDERHAQGR